MNIKRTIRIVVDVLMTLSLLLLMGYSRVGEDWHEWIGVAMFVLFISQHLMNRGWIKNLFHGKYHVVRVIQTILAGLLLLTMLGSMMSGIMMSKHVFAFLNIRSGMSWARTVHMLCGYWNLILMSLHLGIHWIVMLNKPLKQAEKTAGIIWSLRILAFAVASYGVYALLANDIPSYLFGEKQFAFFDSNEPLISFLADYIAIMALFVWIGHYSIRFIRGKKNGKKGKDPS